MNPIFEQFPDALFLTFRNQMLMGKVPSETVQRILQPLLSNFYEVMLQLPPGLQADFENIFRRYSDVAEHFGVRIKPSVIESLSCFSRYRQRIGSGERVPRFVCEGQGFFTTDRGNPVYIEFSCSEGDDFASFEYKPSRLFIEIHICGIYLTTLTPHYPYQRIPVDNLFQILTKSEGETEIKIIELT